MSGAIKETGVLPPEVAVDPQPFFQELAKRNIIMRKISEEVLVSPEVGKVLLQSK